VLNNFVLPVKRGHHIPGKLGMSRFHLSEPPGWFAVDSLLEEAGFELVVPL
jgi:hypothetical protein